MDTETTRSSSGSAELRGVRRMLVLFGVLGILGVLMLAISVVLGIIVLVVAETFFVLAYRRFSKSSRSRE